MESAVIAKAADDTYQTKFNTNGVRMIRLLGLAFAGAVGTVCRYFITLIITRHNLSTFPWATLTVNVLGCLLFGLFVKLTEYKLPLNHEIRTVILIGFAGAFTTFSTFAYDTHELMKTNNYSPAFGNIVLHLLVGFVALMIGIKIASLLI